MRPGASKGRPLESSDIIAVQTFPPTQAVVVAISRILTLTLVLVASSVPAVGQLNVLGKAVRQEVLAEQLRSGSCPMTRFPRDMQTRGPGPYEFSFPSAFSCPVFRFQSGRARFNHPGGGDLEIQGVLQAGNSVISILPGEEPLFVSLVGQGTGVDSDGGDNHVVGIDALANIDSMDMAQCEAGDAFRSDTPTTRALLAETLCPFETLYVDPDSIEVDDQGQVTKLEARLTSKISVRMDHGIPAPQPGARGATYVATLTTVYEFEVDADKVSAVNPTPALDLDVPSDEPTDYSVDADYQLKTQEQAELQLALFDAGGNQIDGSEPVMIQEGSGNQRLSLTSVRPESGAEKVILRILMRGLDGSLLAQSADLEWKVGESVDVTRIEVIQVIQTEDNSVPLIAGKPGIARVFVDPVDSRALDKLVLVGKRAGVTLPGSPLSPKSTTPDEFGALQFNLPTTGDWLKEGVTELIAGLQTGQDFTEVRALTAAFQPAAPLSIRYVRFCRETAEGCVHPAAGKLDLLLQRLYPVTPERYSYGPAAVPPRVIREPIIEEYRKEGARYRAVSRGVSRLRVALRRYQIILARKGLLGASDQLIGFVPSDRGEFKRVYTPARQSRCGDRTRSISVKRLGGVADPLWSGGTGRTMLIRAPSSAQSARSMLRTFAHEIGHNMGLAHPGPPYDPGCSENGLTGYWPYPDVKIQGFGYDSVRDRLLRPDDFVDMMSYSRPSWITPFHYDRLVEGQFRPQGKEWQTRPWSGRLEEEAPSGKPQQSQQVLVSGFFNDDGSEAGIDPVIPLPDGVAFGEFSDGSTTCLRLSGAGGGVAERCIETPFEEYESNVEVDSADFAVVMDAPTPLVRAELLQAGLVIATREAGEAAPEVAITSPMAGASWSGSKQSITWSASDADGDALTYTVSYSSDGGITFLPLEADLEATEFAFDASQIEGGDNVFLEVLATDGLHAGAARVGPISVVQQPQMELAPASVNLGATVPGHSVEAEIELRNVGAGPLTVDRTLSSNEAFEVVAPLAPFTVSAGEGREVLIRYASAEVGAGRADITFESDDPGVSSVTLEATAESQDADTPLLAVELDELDFGDVSVDDSLRLNLPIRNPSAAEVSVVPTVQGNGFELVGFAGAGPAQAEPMVLGPSQGAAITIAFSPTSAGDFTGSISLASNDEARPDQTVALFGSAIEAVAAGQLPTIAAGGVVDAAQFKATLSPGGLGSIFGTDLAPQIAGATSTPLPTELAGVSVEVNGAAAPLIFVSPNQINFQMPFEAAGSSSVEIRAVRDGVAGPVVQAAVSTFAPQVFANPNTGEPIVIRQDGSLVDAAHPAVDQDVLTIFLTGVGGLDNPPATGAATPGSPLASATAETTVTIGGQPAEVFFLGLTPGFIGLVQANIRAHIPAPPAALSPEGAAVLSNQPLVVTVGGAASESLDLPVDVPGGVPPQIDFEPVGLDFGEVGIGQEGRLTVTVFNRGGSNLTVGPVSTTSTEFRANAAPGTWVLAPGASQGIQVEFTPAETGTRFGSLVIVSNDPLTPEVRVPLVGRGVEDATPGQLAITPSTVDFGSVEVGQTVARDVSVSNTGGSAISLNGLNSSAPDEFSVQPMGAALPVELPPGGSYPARVLFQPAAVGDRTATLTASSGASGVNATLRGTSVAAPTPSSSLVVTRSVLNFGSVSFGRTHELPVVVRNDGEAAESITAVISTDGQFRLDVPVAPIAIEPGQETILRIHFTPVNAGLQQATLTVETAAGPLATMVEMTGSGQPGPAVLLSDSFERADAATCAVGAADHAFGGSGTYRYSAIAAGVRLHNGLLENAARDFGGVALSKEAAACPGSASTIGQDLNIRVRVMVPRSGDRTTQAGPFFHAPTMTSGARLEGGGQAGHWVQLDSSGGVIVQRLDTWQEVAISFPLPGFDASKPHTIEVAVRGATAEVAIDGRLRLFDQGGGTGRQTINLVSTGNLSQGAVGVGFSAYNGPGSVGGQTMDDLIVTEHESLAGLPVAR